MAYHVYDNPKTMGREIRGERPDEYAAVSLELLIIWQDNLQDAIFHVPHYFHIDKPWGYFSENKGDMPPYESGHWQRHLFDAQGNVL